MKRNNKKYKRLFTNEGFYNDAGMAFAKEYDELVEPFLVKHMLLGLDCKDMECMILKAIALPMAALVMKRVNGIGPFEKEEKEKNEETSR
jgi:hypothetical protein